MVTPIFDFACSTIKRYVNLPKFPKNNRHFTHEISIIVCLGPMLDPIPIDLSYMQLCITEQVVHTLLFHLV